MAPAAPKPPATPLLPMYQPINALPSVNSDAVSALPTATSHQPMRARGIHL